MADVSNVDSSVDCLRTGEGEGKGRKSVSDIMGKIFKLNNNNIGWCPRTYWLSPVSVDTNTYWYSHVGLKLSPHCRKRPGRLPHPGTALGDILGSSLLATESKTP